MLLSLTKISHVLIIVTNGAIAARGFKRVVEICLSASDNSRAVPLVWVADTIFAFKTHYKGYLKYQYLDISNRWMIL